jgi:Arc/MetJ-type ribon-helix-helix transcriptional regulator
VTDNNNEGEIVRKKFSITEYHNNLLNKIVKQRYASRSEALRVAIQHQAQYLNEGGETNIESLQSEIKQILEEVETIQENLDERSQNVVRVADQNPGRPEAKEQSQASTGIKEKIVKELLEQGPLSIEALAEGIDEDLMRVITAKESLEDEGILCPVDEDTNKYKLNK